MNSDDFGMLHLSRAPRLFKSLALSLPANDLMIWIRLIFLAVLSLTCAAYGADIEDFRFNCKPDEWQGPPEINDEGLFVAQIASDCEITLNVPGSIRILRRNLEASMTEMSVGSSFEKTPDVSFNGLPGFFAHATLKAKKGNYDMTFDSQIHMASDDETIFFMTIDSNVLRGTGNSKYLKKILLSIEVNWIREGVYRFKMTHQTYAQKPTSIIPNWLMKEIVAHLAQKLRDRTIVDYAGYLYRP